MIHCVLIVGLNRFESGVKMIKSAKNPNVKLHIVWRGYSTIPNLGKLTKASFQTALSECSLSMGRNLMLSKILSDESVSDNDVICFADDDGEWPSNLPKEIEIVFSQSINWALGIYGPIEGVNRARFPFCSHDYLDHNAILERGSSLGIYARVGLVRKAGYFDEELGLGSRIPVGEDLDFILRLKRISREAPYRPSICQIHEYSSVDSKERMISSLHFYCYMKTKGLPLTMPFTRRVCSLFLKDVLSLKEFIHFLRLWLKSIPA